MTREGGGIKGFRRGGRGRRKSTKHAASCLLHFCKTIRLVQGEKLLGALNPNAVPSAAIPPGGGGGGGGWMGWEREDTRGAGWESMGVKGEGGDPGLDGWW